MLKIILILLLTSACGSIKNPFQKKSSDEEATLPAPTPSTGAAIPLGGELTNLPEVLNTLQLAPYHRAGYRGQGLRIAVLDNGFMGVQQLLGKSLPPNTKIIKGKVNVEAETIHGTKLAEIVYSVATGSTRWSAETPGPEMILLNSNGFSNLKAAIEEAINLDVHMIVYSQVWEFGGNFDGKGFINKLVDQAVEKNILWLNASGNYGQSTYSTQLTVTNRNEAKLPFEGRYVRFKVSQAQTPVRITLSWNDFQDSKEYRTAKDLDLILEDDKGKKLAESRLIQDGKTHDPKLSFYSAHAREMISGELSPGTYRLRVEVITRNFPANTRIRLAADGEGVQFLDKTEEQSVMIPADNANVLTIGASDTNYNGFSSYENRGFAKPELLVPSRFTYSEGLKIEGSSAATAVAAGAFAVLQSSFGRVTQPQVLQLIHTQSITVPNTSGGKTPLLRLPLRN